MKVKQHFLVFIICLGIFLYDWITFADIRTHPYMIGLFIVVGLIAYWHLVLAIAKFVFFKPK